VRLEAGGGIAFEPTASSLQPQAWIDRLPSWTHWLLAEFHVRLHWSTVSLRRIAIDTSQNTVRPSRQSTLSTRNNVVNRELFAARLLSTVLTAHLVTLENVSAAEGYRLRQEKTKEMHSFWKAEIVLQYSHRTNSDRLRSKLDSFRPRTTNFVLQNRLARSTKHSLDSLCPSFANSRNLTDVHKMPDADPLSDLP